MHADRFIPVTPEPARTSKATKDKAKNSIVGALHILRDNLPDCGETTSQRRKKFEETGQDRWPESSWKPLWPQITPQCIIEASITVAELNCLWDRRTQVPYRIVERRDRSQEDNGESSSQDLWPGSSLKRFCRSSSGRSIPEAKITAAKHICLWNRNGFG